VVVGIAGDGFHRVVVIAEGRSSRAPKIFQISKLRRDWECPDVARLAQAPRPIRIARPAYVREGPWDRSPGDSTLPERGCAIWSLRNWSVIQDQVPGRLLRPFVCDRRRSCVRGSA